MSEHTKALLKRERRKSRVRYKLINGRNGTRANPGKYRISIHISDRNIYAQIIDDVAAKVLCSASTLSVANLRGHRNKESARVIGETIADLAIAQELGNFVFDRGALRYHNDNIVGALANAMRAKGLKF